MKEQRSREGWQLPASIFDDPRVAAALGSINAEVGSWVEYGVFTKGAGALRARFSILPPALPDGRYWLEINTLSEDVPPSSAKMLVHGSLFERKNVEKLFIYV